VGSGLATAYVGNDVIALRHADLDITNADAVDAMVRRVRPDVIFNCAVIGVDDCEADPALAERVNVAGPEALARAAEDVGAAMVHFSTNYVFDGERISALPYTIDDEARPINVYGVTKLRGEHAVAASLSRAFIVRTSWVFGPGGRNFLSTVAGRLARGERVQTIVDTFASATSVGDLVARTIELVKRGEYGTYHVVNDGICSYESFAREAARLVQADEARIDRVTETSLARPALRPRWTPMRCLLSERLGFPPLRSWENALSEFVDAARPYPCVTS
jgi:dTDP-4-dehydrorhamnose reductase